MKKSTIIIIPIIIVVLSVSVLAVNHFSPFFKFGQKLKQLNNAESGDTIAIVNGEEIKAKEFERSKAIQEMTIEQTALQLENDKEQMNSELYEKMQKKNKPKSDKELLDKLIQQAVIRQDIKKQNITVTQEEISKAVEDTMKTLESSKNNAVNPTFYDDFVDLIRGMGYTMEQYQNELLPTTMKSTLESNKYYENYKKELTEKEPDISFQQVQEKYDEHIKKLVKSADIKILVDF